MRVRWKKATMGWSLFEGWRAFSRGRVIGGVRRDRPRRWRGATGRWIATHWIDSIRIIVLGRDFRRRVDAKRAVMAAERAAAGGGR